MDWKRAKTILIWMFIILNIILAAALYRDIKGGEIPQRTIENTRQILEQNNVLIECPIPKYMGNDYILQYDETVLDRTKIANVLLGDNYSKKTDTTYEKGTESLVFTGDSAFEYKDAGSNKKIYTQSRNGMDVYVKELSKKLGIPFNDFRQDDFYTPTSGDISRVVYKGVYKGYTVFDNYIDVEVGKTGLKSIKYHYKKPMNITSREDIKVIPAYEILITRITKYPGIIIRDVDIGFKGYTEVDKDTKTLYEGLSWRIKTSDGKEFYFNARNGEEMD